MKKVLVAPDSFKGTFTAAEVADHVAAGLRSVDVEPILCPVADGGEGTLDAFLLALPGEVLHIEVEGPLGEAVRARIGLFNNRQLAVVEMAEASGLGLLGPGLDSQDREAAAIRATSYGTGQLIAHAIQAGAKEILVGVGGSATTDGGKGAIDAVESLVGIFPPQLRLRVLADVDVPFERAAQVFAPQKGAGPAAVQLLRARLDEFAEDFERRYGRNPAGVPFSGAAGGLAGGLWSAFDASLTSGAQAVVDLLRLPDLLPDSAAVVVGEGRLDSQTGSGKIVSVVASQAGCLPVFAVVGQNTLSAEECRHLGIHQVFEATDAEALRAAGRMIGELVVQTKGADGP